MTSYRYFQRPECFSTFSYENVAKVTVVLSVTAATMYGIKKLRQKRRRREKVEKTKHDCSASKKRLENHLTEAEAREGIDSDIPDLELSELQRRLKEGTLDPVSVIRAYQHKALAVDKRLNCIVEPISEAEDWARTCNKGALYGIPISVKDIVPIKGYNFTLGGCANVIGMAHQDDGSVIKILKKQGAVPFVITNAPQTLMSLACVNPVFGFTGNPHNPNRTSGGSSGGEAALIGGHGSVLGIGTDLGGSIRLPAAFCGICGLKPTQQRSSYGGFMPISQAAVAPTNGYMTRDVNSIVSFMKAILVPDMWEEDPAMTPLPFREEIFEETRPLKIGFYKDDGYYPSIPAYHRAIDIVKYALEKKGHTMVPFEVPDVKYAVEELGFRTIFGDGAEMMKTLLDGDVVSHDLILNFRLLRLPPWIRRIVAWLDSFRDKRRAKLLMATCQKSTISEWWTLTANVQMYRTRVTAEWQKHNLDAVICPPCACVAMPDGYATRMGIFYSYTFLYNVLNFPAGVVPVTRVNQDDMNRMRSYKTDCDSQLALKQAMEGSEGMPVGVQCVGLPFREELVLRVMRDIETEMKSLS